MTFEDVTQSPYFSISFGVVAVLGIFTTYFFYRRSKRERKPYYSVVQRTIIQNKKPSLPGLSIHFQGNEQEMITVANVMFWNRGKETIRDVDIAQADPLRIAVDAGTEVLDARILKCCEDANQCNIGMQEIQVEGATIIPLQFDYLDQNEGMLVQIVHNGSRSHRISVKGKVKGSAEVFEYDIYFSSRRFPIPFLRITTQQLKPLTAISTISFFFASIVLAIIGVVEKNWVIILVAAPFFIAGLFYYSIFFRTLIPKRLKIGL